jgi:putative transposase
MQLVERHIVLNDKAIEEICFKSARLYNFCNYYVRKAYFGEVQKFKEYELSGILSEYKQDDFKSLPAQTSQQVIKLLFKNWKSFFVSVKDYKINPKKYTGKPKIPNFKKKKGFFTCIFTGQQVKLKDGYINFPKGTINRIKTKVDNICQVRIIPQATCFVIEVVYEKQTQKYDLNKNNFLAFDLGLDNLATSINNVGLAPFIVNGKVLKSVNQMFNKDKAKLMSYVGDKRISNRIKKITHYRNNFIEDKLHKISRFIVDYCVENNIGKIVIGNNKQWKTGINIGKKNNQKFVNIPHSKLIDKIRYKSEMIGIELELNEESYTSKIDHLALEPMKKQDFYLGKRIKRGLFQSSTKKVINADVNGAVGIARKVFGDSVIPQIFDSGLAFNPYKINIL